MSSLKELNDTIERLIIDHSDHDTGEIDPEIGLKIDELRDVTRPQKVLSVAHYARGELIEAEAIRAMHAEIISQYDKMLKRAQTHENRYNSLVRYMQMNLEPGEKFEDASVVVKWRNSEHVAIAEGASIPEQYMRVKISEAPDKVAIRDALKAGEDLGDDIWIQKTQKIVVE